MNLKMILCSVIKLWYTLPTRKWNRHITRPVLSSLGVSCNSLDRACHGLTRLVMDSYTREQSRGGFHSHLNFSSGNDAGRAEDASCRIMSRPGNRTGRNVPGHSLRSRRGGAGSDW